MIGFLLFLVSSILKITLSPFLYIHGSIISLKKGEWKKYNKTLAVAKDQYGNVLGQYLFNNLFITGSRYKFGSEDETISSVIGKNKLKNTLTKTGKILDFILNKLEKDHSIKAIEK